MVKKLILKIAGVLIVVAIINVVANYFFYDRKLPYYWGNRFTLNKRNFLVQHKADFNTLFIGSSKTHYQVDPLLFDSLVNSSANEFNKVHSYNFGIDGMMPPESFFIYKSLLQRDSLKFKTAIIELNFLETGETKNLFTWRGYYWLNRNTYNEYSSSLLGSRYPFVQKAWNLSLLNVMAIEQFYNMGKFNELVEFHQDQYANDTSKEVRTHGFTALPHPGKFSQAEDQRIVNIKNASINATDNYNTWSSEKMNAAFNDCLKQIIDLSHQKGIRLIFLFPTQWNVYQYKELFPILNTIPDRNKIVIYQYSQYKTLFEPDHLFDNSHVDSVGARLYTGYVADAFKKIQ